MRLKLPDVTLVALDTVCHELVEMAINSCQQHAYFGAVRVFSDKIITPGTIVIPKFNEEEACYYAYHDMLDHIPTSHMLFIQWDSWIIDPEMWDNSFLKYDYIGAPWGWHSDSYNVGNSGFCLRTKALMKHIADNPDRFPIMPGKKEDDLICRSYRPHLPQFSWAPIDVASRFSFERSRPDIASRHFGFHGLFNWPFVLSPPKLSERIELARKNQYILNSKMLDELDNIAMMHWLKLAGRVITRID